MKRIALLVAHLHRYDAIAADLHGLAGFFSAQGILTKIFASSSDPGIAIHPMSEVHDFIHDKNDGILLSYAGSWQKGEIAFRKSKAQKFFRYHNVTPPDFFEKYDPLTANMCKAGREGLVSIIADNKINLYLPDSDFNAVDLVNSGADRYKIKRLPVFHNIEALLKESKNPDPLILSLFSKNEPVILMVGRIVPNKGYKNLIKGFGHYKKYFQKNATLVLAGSSYPSFHVYYRELEDLIQENNLENHIIMLSGLNNKQLATLYKRADVFSICSEHEGFCVPLIESMALGTPILALAKTAVDETLADNGISWKEFDSATWAFSLDRMIRDKELSKNLVERGYKRYNTSFSNSTINKMLESIIKEFL